MSQSKKQTLIEVFVNVCIGFIGSWLITYIFINYNIIGYVETATIIVSLCTVWSIIRSYCIRRFFNWYNYERGKMYVYKL